MNHGTDLRRWRTPLLLAAAAAVLAVTVFQVPLGTLLVLGLLLVCPLMMVGMHGRGHGATSEAGCAEGGPRAEDPRGSQQGHRR